VGGGLFLIVALWLALVWTLREFAAVKPAAAWMMLPFVAWVSLLAALNLGIWRMNQ
jgi:tryptophan-rich sensory protein